jgi:hypothetical protein
MQPLEFIIECDDYRTLKIPNPDNDNIKLGTLFAKVEDLPERLLKWIDVNPRNPKYTKGGNLSGAVSRSIVKTLNEMPRIFSLKNLGIYILVDDVVSKRITGDKHIVTITLSNPQKHGIVNGGHTFSAIRQVIDQETYEGDAYVRLHLYMNVPEEDIVELAEGLNKNLQVTQVSLSNLVNKFEIIKTAMKGKRGESEIAYADGDPGKVDVLDVLHILSCFDLSQYPSNEKHPNDIFGSKQKILDRYCKDIEDMNSAYKILIKNLSEFLTLSDEVQKKCALKTSYYKIKGTYKDNRVGSDNHKKDAIFSSGVISGFIPQGWLFPMIAAFRANLSKSAWAEGEIKWLIDPIIILDEIIDKLAELITSQHRENKNKPGEVGRKATAYDLCYSAVFMVVAMKGKLEISSI